MGYTCCSKATAEFLGTFILMAAFTNVTVNGDALGALAVASALMIMIYAVGGISGGHFNPAVSIAMAVMSFTGWVEFGCGQMAYYILSQLLGAFFGAWINTLMWTKHDGPSSSMNATVTNITNNTGALAGDHQWPWRNDVLRHDVHDNGAVSVYGSEFVYTMVLVFVIFNVATCNDTGKEKNWYAPLSIGFVIVAAASAVGGISGCCLNPAVSFGATMMNIIYGKTTVSWLHSLGYWLIYACSQIGGAFLALAFFYICRVYYYKDGKEKQEPGLCSKLMSEFMGTFVLTLTVQLVVNAKSPIAAVGIAASLMVMIYSLGAVSGANFNPAVSLGLACIGALPILDMVLYMVIQLIAAACAFGVTCLLLWGDLNVALDVAGGNGNTTPAAEGPWFAVMLAEFIFTCMLVFTVLNVAVGDGGNQYYGLAIAFVIVVGAASVGSLSGGAFNPAVALAIDLDGIVAGDGATFGWCFLYMLIEFIAALVAAALYKLVRCEDGETDYSDIEADEE